MSSELFGTDGVRGEAGVFPIDPEGAWRLGRSLAESLGNCGAVFVGRDPRPSGEVLRDALADGLTSAGCDVVDLGIVPTPAVAFMLGRHGGAAGVAISASHNRARDNGFKFFDGQGQKLSPEQEDAVQAAFEMGTVSPPVRGQRRRLDSAVDEYVQFACSTMPAGVRLDGLRLAVDCGHGATAATTPATLRALGATVVAYADDLRGELINHECGSQHPHTVAELAERTASSIGLAHDGDGDRVVFVDERRQVVSGDQVIGLTARAAAERGEPGSDLVVGTVLTNLGLEQWLSAHHIAMSRTAVGDRNVWLAMKESGAAIGGEPSGHVIYRHLLSTDDALLTALQLLAVVASSGRALADLAGEVKLAPQAVRNVEVLAKPQLEAVPAVDLAVAEARQRLNGDGRLVVRYSGTENLARIMAEGLDAGLLDQVVGDVAKAFTAAGLTA